MKRMTHITPLLLFCLAVSFACKQKTAIPTQDIINDLSLKRGSIISCSPEGTQFGTTAFETSCGENENFNLGIKLLHSFEYDEAEKAFAKVIDIEPGCAMAYWGVAMANFHPLWTPPTEAELTKGAKAAEIAQSLRGNDRENAYISAISVYYKDWKTTDHKTRSLRFETEMEKVYKEFPDDKEAAIFYALSLDAAADPEDKDFVKQKKAGSILQKLYPNEPDHPGVTHYIIHTYDYPELANQGLAAARKYASIAPSSAHALHMPSHIFTRLGLWDECITSNIASVTSGRCYAEAAGIKGHWDEELHGLDYLMYAYLQKGQNDSALKQIEYLRRTDDVHPMNFKVAYAFAAIPSRYVLENKMWDRAASMQLLPAGVQWNKYPWQEAIVHFTRLMGAVHTNKMDAAQLELELLNRIHDTLMKQKDSYKANQVSIQHTTGKAWIAFKTGKNDEAIALMRQAAEMEDKTQKHPVTPGEVIPARELLGDMYLAMNKPVEALIEYEVNLKKHPNRFNGLYSAGIAAEKSGNIEKSREFFRQLSVVVGNAGTNRPEMRKVKGLTSQGVDIPEG